MANRNDDEATLAAGFPGGALRIGEMVSMLVKDGQVTYFIGNFSISHGIVRSAPVHAG